jgi:hypothetical protein
MRERVGGRWDRFRLYLLVNLNRFVLTGALTVGTFLALVAAAKVNVVPLRQMMQQAGVIPTLFQSLIGAVLTSVTLVVTINQIVFAQDIGSVSEEQDRLDDALSFRQKSERILEEPSPAEPSRFLERIVETARADAETLHTELSGQGGDHDDGLGEFLDALQAHAREVSRQLDDAEFGNYEVIDAAVNFNYSWKLHRLRQYEFEHGASLDDAERQALEDLLGSLEQFAVTREYLEGLYIQWELVNLSRAILYTAVPATLVAAIVTVYVDPLWVPGTTMGIDNIVWLISGAIAVTVTPFHLLGAYILRLATISKRTLAPGPFILRSSERSEDTD